MNRGSTGGGHDARGGQFEAYSILFYFLKRRIEHPRLEPVIQPSEGDDAKFIYTIESGGKTQVIEELIQCKKTETSDSSRPDPVVPSMNRWMENSYSPSKLKEWIEENHKSNSSASILAKKENTYYTALLFGEATPFFKAFVPPKLLKDGSVAPIDDDSRWSPGSFSERFSPKFKHAKFSQEVKERLRKSKFKTGEAALKKIRVLFIPSPDSLKHACRRILEEPPYRMSPNSAVRVVGELIDEIEKQRNYVIPESNRLPLRGVFDSIIESGKLGQGEWLAANEFLERGAAGGGVGNGRLPGWEDFREGRYVSRPEFGEALEALERDGFVVIHSRRQFGTGKTTLCRFLAYDYLRQNSGRKVFYLPARVAASLDEEVEFFRAHLKDDALFIVDDEDFLHDEVNRLVEEFWKIHSAGTTPAKLVVTTTNATAYTISQAYVAKPDASDLHQAAQIKLRPDATEMGRILAELRTRGLLEIPASISTSELASLSDGSLALAIAVGQCARELTPTLDVGAMLRDRNLLGRALTKWILLRLNRAGDDDYFREEVAPVFIVASLGLPAPERFKAAGELRDNLFLYDAAEGPSGQTVLFGVNLNTASALSAYYEDRRAQALSAYLKEYREYLPLVCKRLMQEKEGTLLQEVLKACSEEIVETLDDPVGYPIGINGVGVVLRAFYKVYRDGGNGAEGAALKLAGCQKIRAVGQGFPDFMLMRAHNSARSLRSYLEAAHPVNKVFMRRVIAKEYLEGYRPSIISLLEDDACPIDEIAAALRTFKKYSPDFAEGLYKYLIHSEAFKKKVAEADEDERALFIWVRFCEHLRPVNRAASYEYLEAHVQENKVLDVIRGSERFNYVAPLLLRLHLLRPRLATTIVTRLWEESPQALESMLRKEEEIPALCEGFKALSKLNRRVAVHSANVLKDRLGYLLGKETQHRKAAAALERLLKYTSLKLTQSVAESIDRQPVLESLRRDDVLDLVGKTLYNFSEVDPSLAGWFADRLDYSDYMRSSYVKHLRQLVYLVRGFMRATLGKEAQEELLSRLVEDATLRRAFRGAWDQRADLSEMAVCLALLLDIPISRGALLELLEFTNDAGENFEDALDDFGKNFAGKFEYENSVLHVASGLFGAAKLDPDLAIGILDRYVERVETETPPRQEETPMRRRRTRPAPDNPRRDYTPSNLVDVGRVLMIAAAIKPSGALRLARLIDLEAFARYEAAEEQSLGRLAVFIWGLQQSSRKMARDFLRRICTEERWREQYKDNEDLENVLHYAHSLRHVSRATGNEFMRFVVANHHGDIRQALMNEVNLMTVSNWLRASSDREQSAIDEEVNSFIGLLEETADFDTRLHHLIEATGAAIECGQGKLSRRFAARALSESSQLLSVRKLETWIVLFHKALRIERELGIANFAGDLFKEINNPGFLTGLLSLNNQPLLDSYVVYLLKHTNAGEMPAFKALGESLAGSRRVTVDVAKLEPRKALRILLSLILAKSPVEEIHKFVAFVNEHLEPDENGALYEPWESGLLALVFRDLFPEEGVLLADPLKDSILAWRQIILQQLNEHTGNLEYGLTLYLAKQVGVPDDVLAEFDGAVEERAGDEVNSAVSVLLKSYRGGLNFRGKPYLMWRLLKDSVLRATYLPWESDIEDAQDSPTFEQASVRKIDVILPY